MHAGLQSCQNWIRYNIHQETVYYLAETDPVKKQQHSNNLAHLYALQKHQDKDSTRNKAGNRSN